VGSGSNFCKGNQTGLHTALAPPGHAVEGRYGGAEAGRVFGATGEGKAEFADLERSWRTTSSNLPPPLLRPGKPPFGVTGTSKKPVDGVLGVGAPPEPSVGHARLAIYHFTSWDIYSLLACDLGGSWGGTYKVRFPSAVRAMTAR